MSEHHTSYTEDMLENLPRDEEFPDLQLVFGLKLKDIRTGTDDTQLTQKEV